MSEQLVDLRYAKSGNYRRVLESIEKSGKCPFCPENFIHHGIPVGSKFPIIHQVGGWYAVRNSWPYRGARFHFLIVPEKHFRNLGEISGTDWLQVVALVSQLSRKFKVRGGGLNVRFGEPLWNGSTVSHIHFHLIVPGRSKSGKITPVQFPIG